MTEAEALDMAAKAAGWRDWKEAHERTWELDRMRAHAATIMENAENARLLSMSAEREINLRGELLRLQRKNAALNAENERLRQAVQVRMDAKHREAAEAKLWFTKAQAWKAENERLREALETIVNNCGQCGGYGTYPEEEIITGKVLWSDCSSPQCQEARAALKENDNGDR